MSRPTKGEALVAIVEWMGCYEGADGEPIGDLLDLLDPADDEAFAIEQEVPLDMVAGYRLAVRMLATHEREIGEARAFRTLRAEHPGVSSARIRAAIRKARVS